MDQVTVDQGFWDLFPDAQVNIFLNFKNKLATGLK